MLVLCRCSPEGHFQGPNTDVSAAPVVAQALHTLSPEAARGARRLVDASPRGAAPAVTLVEPRSSAAVSTSVGAIARDRPILDSDVLRVAVGAGDEIALVKARGSSYVIENEAGRQLVHSWDDPILAVAWLPNGKVAYLVEDSFFNRLEVRDQSGQRLWDDFGSSNFSDPSALSVAADGKLYFLRSPSTITDDRGMQIYRGWPDETIAAFAVVSRSEFYVATRDSMAGRDRYVLKDARGRRLHEFERGEQVDAIRVRGKTLTYVSRRRTDVFPWVRTVTLR